MGKKFGDCLKELRLQKGMSQDELAKLLGTTKQVISKYETNQRTPKITVANEYAKKLNVNLNYLLGEDESESLYDRYNKIRKPKGAVMFRGGDSDSDPFYMSAEEAEEAEAFIRTRRKMQEEQGK